MRVGTLLMVFFGIMAGSPLWGLENPECIFSGTWGKGPAEIGLELAAPDMLPQGPFMGPGGFRVDAGGEIWISDSVQKALKVFSQGKVRTVPVPAEKLGDLFLYKDRVFVATVGPKGVMVLDKASGKLLQTLPVPFQTPGRMLVADEDHLAIEETGGGLWVVVGGKAEKHPASALEPIGTAKTLFGTLFDFDPASRKLIQAGWVGEATDPELFALHREPGKKIIFSRLLGILDESPVFFGMTASDATSLDIVAYAPDGTIKSRKSVKVLSTCYLPAAWIVGNDGKIYGMEADLKGFGIVRIP